MDQQISNKINQKDTKAGNQLLILQTLLKGNTLSRVELAEKTGLSASTVTSLTADLLSRGAITESGERVYTAGRSRVGLTVNDGLGLLIVAEISRRGAFLTALDMHLNVASTRTVDIVYADGNQAFGAITEKIDEFCGAASLAGIGLLFQEDVLANDFNVMYSTGRQAATITLREALENQLHVPVLEETGQTFTVPDALAAVGIKAHTVAHIRLGETIRAVLVIDGSTVPLRNHFAESLCGNPVSSVPGPDQAPSSALVALLNLLYAMLPLDVVLIANSQRLPDSFIETLKNRLNSGMLQQTPDIRLMKATNSEEVAVAFAERVRGSVLRLCVGAAG